MSGNYHNYSFVVFSGKTYNTHIDILSDLSGNKIIALRLRSLLIVPLNSWGDIWSLRAWMYYLYIHSLIGSIAHTDLIQRNWAVISTQARDYLPLLLLHNAKLPPNLVIKYVFSQRKLRIIRKNVLKMYMCYSVTMFIKKSKVKFTY